MAVKRRILEDSPSEGEDSPKSPKPGKDESGGSKRASPRKYTVEDAMRIRKLKEEDKLSWQYLHTFMPSLIGREIAKHFPGCSAHTLDVQYSRRLKGLADLFTQEEVNPLRNWLLTPGKMEEMKRVIVENKKRFWADIGAAMGKTAAGCQRAAKEAKLPLTSMLC